MSRILCVVDGMTDPAFCAEDYPALRAMHRCAAVRTVPKGADPESLTCILTLLGVSAIPPYLRGYAEALGAEIPVKDDDLILRGSWITVEEGRCKLPAAAPAKLRGQQGAGYYLLGANRSLLVLPHMAADAEAFRTRPFYCRTGETLETLRPAGNLVAERIFDENCANGVCMVLWGASRSSVLPPFPQRAAVICGTGVVRGIAKLLKMELIPVPGATGDTDTNLAAKADAALEAAARYPFVLLHINGADEASHRKDPLLKKRFLLEVDRLVLGRLLSCMHTVLVTADHSTDPATGLHGGTVQPVYRIN